MKNVRISALLLALVMVCALLSGCAAKSAYDQAAYVTAPSAGNYYEAKSESAMVEAPMDGGYYATTTEEAYNEEPAETPAPEPTLDTPETNPNSMKIIYSAWLSVETTEFDKTLAVLEKNVKDFGGFVESSNVYGDTRYNQDGTTRVVNRNAAYTVRVPANRFEEFLQVSGGLGNVISNSRNAENITSRYTDFEARLSSLNTQEERLLDMLGKSEDVETLVALEERLSEVRYEIESIERTLRNYDLQVSYSTVTINLREVEIYTPTTPVTRTFGQKLSDAFRSGWRSFGRGLQDLVIGLTEALPALILLAVIVIAVIVIVRRSVKKRRAKKAAQQTMTPPPQNPPQA